MGRLLGALADSPMALETQGATTNVIKVLIFCISAAFASLAGALTAMEVHYAVGSNYDPFESLVYVALGRHRHSGRALVRAHRGPRCVDHPGLLHGEQRDHRTSRSSSVWHGGDLCRLLRAATAAVPLRVRQFLDRLGGRQPEHAVTEEQVRRPWPRPPRPKRTQPARTSRSRPAATTVEPGPRARSPWALGPLRRRHRRSQNVSLTAPDGMHHRVGRPQRGRERRRRSTRARAW